MRPFYLTLATLAAVSASAQFNATITVSDLGSGTPVENATVSLDGNSIATDAAGQAIFMGLADNTYDYSVSATCYNPGSGTIIIAGADASGSLGLNAMTTNSVFFYIGSPWALTGATVEVTNGTGYDASFVTWDTFGGEMLEGVPLGEISYTISKPCYETVSGTVTVDCNPDGITVVANPAPTTTNNLFFYIGDFLAITGATVEVTDGGDYYASFVTWDTFGGEMLADVPFGTMSYTITTPCYETVTGTVTVDCNDGDGIVVSANPAPTTTNNLFFFIGDPLAITGATVDVTNGADYNESFVTSDPFGGEMLADAPFGTVSYTITTPCYETVTGTVTVTCNNGDGIAVITNPAPIVIDSGVTVAGNTITAAATEVDYQWVDCNNSNAPIDGANGQSFEATESGSYAVVLTSGDCSQTSECTSVTVSGVDELQGRDAFAVYPVPFSDNLTVRTNGTPGPVRVELFSLTGQDLLDETRSGMEITVQTAELPSGSYILRLTSDNARTTMSVVK